MAIQDIVPNPFPSFYRLLSRIPPFEEFMLSFAEFFERQFILGFEIGQMFLVLIVLFTILYVLLLPSETTG